MNNSRALIIVLFVIVFFFGLIIKLVDIQIVKGEELRYYAQKQQTNYETIRAERGLIYDRNSILLVYNRHDLSFYVDLRMLSEKKKPELAELFAKTFGKSKSHYSNLLKQKSKTICLEKKAPLEKASLLNDYKLNGLFSKDDPSRVYHYGSLASHILGYVNNDYDGVNGIDKYFDDLLSGENGKRLIEKNAVGELITVNEENTIPAQAGQNIFLTIDKSYQAIVESELKTGVDDYKAESAVGIIMDPNTGEILALCNIDDFDPNEYWNYSDYQRRDRAITDTYEPGSTFKAFSLAALLEEKKCKETDQVFVENGRYKYKTAYITDTHKNGYLTVKGVFEESSNIGLSKLIQKIDDNDYYKYLRAFGFGNYSSICLPGETSGKLKKPNEWSGITKAFMSFGYEISVTPIQLITAYSSLINGGILYQPLLVKKVEDPDGNIISENSPKVVRNVISEKTSERMVSLLQSVVENGTGKTAKSDLISIGGKTGTSKIAADGKYVGGKYNSSFIGFFPVENPKLICLVLVNSPKTEYYGGKVAAPLFKKIVERIVQADPSKFFNIDNTKDSFEKKFSAIQENPENEKKQIGQSGEFKFAALTGAPATKNLMPDLKGLTTKEALEILSELEIKYKIDGTGIVSGQSIQPGAKINQNSNCVINCSEYKINGVNIY
jgi:cell division protein FtsI (penicillin-binding protein 3)